MLRQEAHGSLVMMVQLQVEGEVVKEERLIQVMEAHSYWELEEHLMKAMKVAQAHPAAW
jgi:hypothetical protein